MASRRPLPQPDETTAAYWAAARDGRLVLQRCRDCERVQFYPRALCSHCLSDDLDWIEATGEGEVHSYTTVHRALMPGFEDAVPYVVALIELDEGVRLLSRLVGCAPEAVSVGLRVRAVFETLSEDVAIPNFQPLEDDGRDA